MKVKITYEQLSTRILVIEADNFDDAEERFFNGEYKIIDDYEEDVENQEIIAMDNMDIKS